MDVDDWMSKASYAAWVRHTREKTKMSQERFCETYGIPLTSLKRWELGLHNPRGLSLVYLHVIDQIPDAVNGVIDDLRERDIIA